MNSGSGCNGGKRQRRVRRVYGGISGTRIAVGGSENIMNVAVVTTNNSLKIMGDGSVAANGNSDLL